MYVVPRQQAYGRPAQNISFYEKENWTEHPGKNGGGWGAAWTREIDTGFNFALNLAAAGRHAERYHRKDEAQLASFDIERLTTLPDTREEKAA